MRVVVITRFGLGQKNESFYRATMPFLRAVLAPSIRAQQDKNFEWVLLLDVQVPSWVVREIENWSFGPTDFSLYFHDPFSNCELMPQIYSVLARGDITEGEKLVTVRVDSDDALGINYVRDVKAVATSTTQKDTNTRGPRVLLTTSGALLLSRSSRAMSIEKRDYSVVAVVSTFAPDFTHCYSFPHTKAWRGNGVLPVQVVKGETPHWLRVLRPGSVHRSYRGIHPSEFIDYFPRVKIGVSKIRSLLSRKYRDRITGPLSASQISGMFGIEPNLAREAGVQSRRWASSSIPADIFSRYDPLGRVSLAQLTLKKIILDQMFALGASEDLSPSDEFDYLRLARDFYSF